MLRAEAQLLRPALWLTRRVQSQVACAVSPAPSLNSGRIQLSRSLRWRPRGDGFKSRIPDQPSSKVQFNGLKKSISSNEEGLNTSAASCVASSSYPCSNRVGKIYSDI